MYKMRLLLVPLFVLSGILLLASSGGHSAAFLPARPFSAGAEVQEPVSAPPGDVDCSGTVDSADALQVLRQVAELQTSAQCLAAGDVDCSDDTNSVDALDILIHVAGLSVTLSPGCEAIGGQPATSDELIDKALRDGVIDQETALIYKVFAGFGDPRLPAQYKGDDSQVVDNPAVAEAATTFDSLSPVTQGILAPFLLEPYEPGSWLNQASGAGQASAPQPQLAPCPECPDGVWHTETSVVASVKVWWQKSHPEDEATALTIISQIEGEIWPKLRTQAGLNRPMLDGGATTPSFSRGGDDRFDIYLVDVERSFVRPYGCKQVPAYMVLSRGASRSELAHEFMHAIQFSYNVKDGCLYPGEYAWLAEGSATWAAAYVYPDDNWEHYQAPWFLDVPQQVLETKNDSHEYGSYLLPFYLWKQSGQPQVVAQIWKATESFDSLQAIDENIPGRFKDRWPEFALYNWNRGWPPVNQYWQWDELIAHAKATAGEIVSLGGSPNREIQMPTDIKHLSAQYYDYKFQDDSVRTVAFYNGLTFKLSKTNFSESGETAWNGTTFTTQDLTPDQKNGGNVQALIKIGGQWKVEDWTNTPSKTFCRDTTAERLQEIVLIFSNSKFTDRSNSLKPQDLDPTLWVSNLPCWQWTGTYDASGELPGFPGSLVTITGRKIKWERDTSSNCAGNPSDPSEPRAFECYDLKVGSHVEVTIGGSWTCGQYSGSVSFDPPDGTGSIMRTYNYVTAGPVYRSYLAFAFADGVFLRVLCGQSDNTVPLGAWLILAPFDPSIGPPQFKITLDGKMGDHASPSDTNGFLKNAHISWSFQSQRQ